MEGMALVNYTFLFRSNPLARALESVRCAGTLARSSLKAPWQSRALTSNSSAPASQLGVINTALNFCFSVVAELRL